MSTLPPDVEAEARQDIHLSGQPGNEALITAFCRDTTRKKCTLLTPRLDKWTLGLKAD